MSLFGNPQNANMVRFRTLLFGNGFTQIINFATYVIIARLYDRQDLAILSSVIALTAFFSVLNTGQVQTTFYTNDGLSNQTRLNDSISATAVLTPTLFLLALLLYFTYDFELGLYIFLVPINSFLFSLWEISKSFLHREQDVKSVVSIQFFYRILSQLLKIVGAAIEKSLLVFSEPISNFTANLVFWIKYKPKPNWNIVEVFHRYKRYSMYYVPVSLVNFLTTEAPVLLVTFFGSFKEASAYFLINRIVFSPLNLIGNSFSSASVSELVKDSSHERHRFVKRTYFIFVMAALILTGVNYLFATPIVDFFLGPKYSDLSDLLMALSFVIPIRLLKGIITNTGISSGKHNLIYANKILMGLTLVIFVLLNRTYPIKDLLIGYFLIELVFESIHAKIGMQRINSSQN